jgi:ribosomal protein L3
MTIGLVGRKAGMTRVFTEAGDSLPVTVIEALPNRIVQVKDSKADGYRAIQVTWQRRADEKPPLAITPSPPGRAGSNSPAAVKDEPKAGAGFKWTCSRPARSST